MANTGRPRRLRRARRHDAQAARVHLSRSLEGWWVLSGLLAPDDGELLHAALDAGVDRRLRAAHDGDPSVVGRPVASWRADALVGLAAQSMRREPSEQSAPDRYRIGLLLNPAEVGQADGSTLTVGPRPRLRVQDWLGPTRATFAGARGAARGPDP